MTRQPLTPRQRDCLEALRKHIDDHGVVPSRRELCVALGISRKSLLAVQQFLAALETKGWIKIHRGRMRAIEIIEDTIEVNIYRRIG
jgi:SOS-response transcriptional repressor LexA